MCRALAHSAAHGPLQGRIAQYQTEQEQGLGALQGLVGAALAVPREAVQPAFEALGKQHLAMLAEQQKLQLQPALVTAVIQCIGGMRAFTMLLVCICLILALSECSEDLS